MTDLIQRARDWKSANNFGLYAHASGRWARKIAGKLHFFGPITEDIPGSARVALDTYNTEKDEWAVGRVPQRKTDDDALTVKGLCDRFLMAKEQARDAGELSVRTFDDYFKTGLKMADELGRTQLVVALQPRDFARLRASAEKTLGPVSLGNFVQRVRTFFKHAYDNGLIAAPIRYGSEFKKPSRKVLRKARAEAGTKMFEAADVHKLLANARANLQAMILLAVNVGFGNNDCALLPLSALDLERGWINFPRPKTHVERRCPLWPETVKALKAALAKRREPKQEKAEGLVFITNRGSSWSTDHGGAAVAKAFVKVVEAAGLSQDGRGFYALRHTFRTIADGCRDFPAIDRIMGHVDDSMADRYRERIDDERLQAVVNHVRAWLFKKPAKRKGEKPEEKAGPAPKKPAKSKPTGSGRREAEAAAPWAPRLFVG